MSQSTRLLGRFATGLAGWGAPSLGFRRSVFWALSGLLTPALLEMMRVSRDEYGLIVDMAVPNLRPKKGSRSGAAATADPDATLGAIGAAVGRLSVSSLAARGVVENI